MLKTKSLSKKRNKKKIKSTSFEAGKCTSKDGSAMDEAPYSKDLSTKEQCSSDTASDILLKPPTELNVLSDDEGPPEGLSFSDAKQQVMMEEEHVKQHLAKCVFVYVYACNSAINTYTHVYGVCVRTYVCIYLCVCMHARAHVLGLGS